MLNRRGFMGALAGALALDPERLLWVPGKKLISVPKPTDHQDIIAYLQKRMDEALLTFQEELFRMNHESIGVAFDRMDRELAKDHSGILAGYYSKPLIGEDDYGWWDHA